MSQEFGENPAWYEKFGLAGHNGLDLSCSRETLVYAAHGGTATALFNAMTYGEYVVIRGENCETLYGHLAYPMVGRATEVVAGQQIGESGNTGYSTGPHLHFGVRPYDEPQNNGYKGWVDPLPYLKEEKVKTKTTLHVQRILPWMEQTVVDLDTDWVKLVNGPSGADPFPRIRFKIDRQHTDSIDGGYIAAGYDGGRAFVDHMWPAWTAREWATCHALANEPGCNSNEDLANLREYSIGAMTRADELGIKLMILELPEGNPHDNGTGDPDVSRWKIEQLAPAAASAIARGHHVGLHAYWRPGVAGPLDRWHGLGNVLFIVSVWAEQGMDVSRLQLHITETGIDGGIAGHEPQQGWRDLSDLETYSGEVVELEVAMREYGFIKSAALFTAGFEPPWEGYDHDEAAVRAIMAKLGETAPSDPGHVLEYLETQVIEMVPGFALFDYIIASGWIPCSHEERVGDWVYQCAFVQKVDQPDVRIWLKTQEPYTEILTFAEVIN